MRILACGPVWVMAALTTANAATPLSIAPEILNGGALAVLGWTIWYVLSRTLPAHTRAMEKQREAFLEAIKEERDRGD